ncbi:hypothetical protein ACFXKC_56005 [Streptomyces sp. NPDC059340]|uniref:hypothetical protein n=1 Tax=Streptomyces sp. NPDC059340 TaxID=3346806 RepID=UPI0036C7FE73
MDRPAEPEVLGSAAEAYGFGREYGVVHSPARASDNPSAAGGAARGGTGVSGRG